MRLNFQLMNQDEIILQFDYVEETAIDYYFEEVNQISDTLPYGFTDIEKWLGARKAPKHRKHIKALIAELGCNTLVGYIEVTHAVSLNDTYWVKKVDEDISWGDISPYTNEFNDVVAQYAFSGNLSRGDFSGTIPELSTDGTYAKCWVREDNEIYLCKAGSDEFEGIEPKLECIASDVYKAICANSVEYRLACLNDTEVSKCKLFTDEQNGFISVVRTVKRERMTVQQLYNIYEELGCGGEFRRMLVADAVVMNTDRHLGNVGFMIDNGTQKLINIAPIFDFNKSLLPGLTMEIYENKRRFGEYVKNQLPRLGTDFIGVAKYFMNSDIECDLRKILDEFTINEGSLPEWKVRVINMIIRENILKILEKSGDLYVSLQN